MTSLKSTVDFFSADLRANNHRAIYLARAIRILAGKTENESRYRLDHLFP